MSRLAGLAALLRALVRRRTADADLEDEIQFHLDMETEKNVRDGMPPDEARRVALAHFGGVERVREEHRDARRLGWVEDTLADVRFALRSLGRSPGVSAAIVLTLALGIGANAAIFSVLDRVFFRMPVGVVRPDGLVRLYERPQGGDPDLQGIGLFSYPQYAGVRAAVAGAAALTVYDAPRKTSVEDGAGGDAFSSYVGAGFFPLLGVRPALGRLFTPDEERMGVPMHVVVLSYDFWQRRFSGDSAVIGRGFRIGDSSWTIVGVAQKGFAGVDVDAADFWRPLASFAGTFARGSRRPPGPPWYELRNTRFLQILARPGREGSATAVAARATTGLRLDARQAGWGDSTASIVTGSLIAARGPEKRQQELALSMRIGIVALIVLLIACANVANLLLARAAERRREIAVRLALGVSRRRLVRMLFTESALLAAGASAAAFVAAGWCGAVLRALLWPDAHWQAEAHGTRIVGFTAAVALVVACGTALAPALQSLRTDLTMALKSGAREGSGRRSRLRTALVLAQSGLAAVLVIGAGLFVRSLHNVLSAHLGYEVDGLVFVSPEVPRGAPSPVLAAAVRELEMRLASLPGVERTALVSNPPLYGVSFISAIFRQNGDSLVRRGGGTRQLRFPEMPSVTVASPSYFSTVGMRILRGRTFQSGGGRATLEVVVNESMARRFWPGGDALGRCLRIVKASSPCYTIVGIVEDAHRMQVIENAAPAYYLPAASAPIFDPAWIVVRARAGQAAQVEDAARTLLGRRTNAGESRVISMSEVLAPQLHAWRLGAWLFTALAVLALVLAAMGVYSTLTYTTAQRTHEIGVRLALGARAGDVARDVVRSGVAIVALGIVLGAGLALVLGRPVAELLYGVSPRDPLTFAGAALVLLAVACVAAALPAWRATRVDPVSALRVEL